MYTVHLWTFLDKYVQQIVCNSCEMYYICSVTSSPPKHTHSLSFPLAP